MVCLADFEGLVRTGVLAGANPIHAAMQLAAEFIVA
jgi:hypothetical protein